MEEKSIKKKIEESLEDIDRLEKEVEILKNSINDLEKEGGKGILFICFENKNNKNCRIELGTDLLKKYLKLLINGYVKNLNMIKNIIDDMIEENFKKWED